MLRNYRITQRSINKVKQPNQIKQTEKKLEKYEHDIKRKDDINETNIRRQYQNDYQEAKASKYQDKFGEMQEKQIEREEKISQQGKNFFKATAQVITDEFLHMIRGVQSIFKRK